MTDKLAMIPLDAITPPKDPLRAKFSRPELLELSESIRQLGVIEPLILTQRGKRYQVVAGLRRLTASKMAGLTSVPAIVTQLTDINQALVTWHENAFRTEIQPAHEAQFLQRLMQTHSATQADIAKLIGKSEGWVSDRLKILTYPRCLQDALAARHLSFGAVRELAHISDEAELSRLVRIAIEDGCSARTAASWRQAWQARRAHPPSAAHPGAAHPPSPGTIQPYQVVCDLCGSSMEAKYEQIIRSCPRCYRAIMQPQRQAEAAWPTPPEKEEPHGA